MKNLSGIQKVIVTFGLCLILLGFFLPQPDTVQEPEMYSNQIDIKEKECLKSILWYEARNQSELGIKAVLSVVENRKQHPAYPRTYCGIKNQSWQFSFVHERKQQGKPLEVPAVHFNPADEEKYRIIDSLATEAVSGGFTSLLPANVLHYTTTKVRNHWTKKKKVYAVIEDHKFYISDKGI